MRKMDGPRDVGVFECGEHLRFASETALKIRPRRRQDLQRNLALWILLLGKKHPPHSALPQLAEDAVGPDTLRHRRRRGLVHICETCAADGQPMRYA